MRSAFPIDAPGRNRSRNMSANLTPATTKSPVAAAEQGLAGALWPRVPMPRKQVMGAALRDDAGGQTA